MDHESDGNDWELSKENVKPLRQGRSFADMSMALHEASASRIAEQQGLFEKELRTYAGDDPLDVWVRYINWTEQNFPKGGSNIQSLIQNCVLYFKDDIRYRNDKRYISIWIKFANNTNEPDEIFSFLFNRNIGCKVAALHHAWASVLEQTGNTTKANMVYEKGIELGAEPIDQLRKQHHEFQARVARRVLSSDVENSFVTQQPVDDQEGTRTTLGALPSVGKHGHAPINRASAARSAAGGLTSSSVTQLQQADRNAKMKIFSDENTYVPQLPVQNNEYVSVPRPGAENQQKARKWNDPSVKQKSAGGSHQVPSASGPAITHVPIFQDSEVNQPATSRNVFAEPMTVLAPHRETSGASEPAALFASKETGANQRLMYCHEKLYAGNKECSFEELRAWKWVAKKKEQEEQQRKIDQMVNEKVHLLRASLRADIERDMQEQMAALLQRQLNVVQPSAAVDAIQKASVTSHAEPQARPVADEHESMILGTSHHKEILQPKAVANLMAVDTDELPESPSHLFMGKNTSKPIPFDESLSVRRSHAIGSISSAFTAVTHEESNPVAAVSSYRADRSAAAACDVDGSYASTNQQVGNVGKTTASSTTSGFSCPMAEASMTMNSKEAYKMIYGMFNQTLSEGVDQGLGRLNADEDVEFEKQFALTTASAVPTTAVPVYDETKVKQPAVTQPLGFQIFSENESVHLPTNGAKQACNGNAIGLSLRTETVRQPFVPVDKENYVPMTTVSAAAATSNVHSWNNVEPMVTLPTTSCPAVASTLAGEDVEMKDEHADWDNGEITFNPGCSSTRVFTGSLPFRNAFCSASTTRLPSNCDPFTVYDDANGPTSKMTDTIAAGITSGNSELTASMPRGRMSSIFCGATSKLNTILEGSDESRSKGSSMGSSRHPSSGSSGGLTGLTPSVGAVTHNWTSAATPGDALPACQFSIHEPASTKFEKTDQKDSITCDGQSAEEAAKEFLREELNATMQHVIDVTEYHVKPSDKQDVELNRTVAIDPSNPFDDATIEHLLSCLKVPIHMYPNYHRYYANVPKITKKPSHIELGGSVYSIISKLGEGAFAKVYHVSVDDKTLQFGGEEGKVVKVQHPPCPWEFYITTELNRRLKALKLPINMPPSYMYVEEGLFFNDGSCLVYSYHKYGTLLDFVNIFKRSKRTIPEWFVAYLAIELMDIVDYMHRCQIIHGDFKPDNILVSNLNDIQNIDEAITRRSSGSFLKLIDFGQSIDMTLYPPGTTFTAKVTTKGFQCPEMKTNRPWTYQTDLYGLIGTIHVLLVGSYMNVYFSRGMWRVTTNFQRGMPAVWKRMLSDLLNIKSCSELPDLSIYRNELALLAKRSFDPRHIGDFISDIHIAFVEHGNK